MSIKFIHSRNITSPTKQDQDRGLTFSISCKGGITVGYKWNEEKKILKLAVARCSPEDNFNRRVARDITTGRIESKKSDRFTVVDLTTLVDPTPQKIEDLVWGWLEEQENIWDAKPVSHLVH